MLPSPSASSRAAAATPPGQRQAMLRRFVKALAVFLLPLLLVACGGPGQPPRSVLLDALALQIQLTQGSIAQALALDTPGMPQVSRVRVEEQQAVAIGEGRGLRLAGRFDWRLADDPIRVDSPFELYLARGEKGQSWRLARPDAPLAVERSGALAGATAEPSPGAAAAGQSWITYPLPLPGQRGRG